VSLTSELRPPTSASHAAQVELGKEGRPKAARLTSRCQGNCTHAATCCQGRQIPGAISQVQVNGTEQRTRHLTGRPLSLADVCSRNVRLGAVEASMTDNACCPARLTLYKQQRVSLLQAFCAHVSHNTGIRSSDKFLQTLAKEHRMGVFENRVLWRIFGIYEGEVTGDWRKLHKEKLYNVCSPNIITVIKSKRITWSEHTVRM
jgi:hypothetical protein